MLTIALLATVSCAKKDGGNGGTTTDGEKIGAVTVMGVWGGTEVEAFNKVVSGWQTETGGTVEFEATRDLSAILRARVSGGNPPD
ncbi:MAG TPA: hypothetical protein VFE45_07550, partial [Coriobacteriia bacterium]|nr:hypothetical protein [Coriobacteriia bacterium]